MTNRQTLCLLTTLLLICRSDANKLVFPEYSYEQHPMHYLPQFADDKPNPVIMKKYTHFFNTGKKVTFGSVFAPLQAKYDKYGTTEPFFSGLDVLYVWRGADKDSAENFTKVELNDAARVFILLRTPWLKKSTVHEVSSSAIKGLENSWKGAIPLETSSGSPIYIGRGNSTRALPARAVALERTVSKDEALFLPNARMITINGRSVWDFAVVFARPNVDSISVPRAFPYPSSPESVRKLDTGKTVDIRAEPVVPNTKCPDWLHDLYRTSSRDADTGLQYGELMYWRTWHPPIDPIYWCYFDHEHGSYPGKYKPTFDYTAYKTFDATTSHEREEESDQGFKVYSIALQAQKKYAIFIVHIRTSQARRFFTRHHTGIFAVLNEKWELEMELQMKMDFGAAMATLVNNENVAMNAEEAAVQSEMDRKRYDAFRRFNVIDVDESLPFPQSLNMSLRYNQGLKPSAKNKILIMHGMYENWMGVPNTCAFCKSRRTCGLLIDIRNVATAKRTMAGGEEEEMQWLQGNSLSREVKIQQDFELGLEHCHFNIFESTGLPDLEGNKGVFYTDVYFSEVHAGAGKNCVRQFIKHGSKAVVIAPGTLTSADPWSGPFEYAETSVEKSRQISNAEHAVLREVN